MGTFTFKYGDGNEYDEKLGITYTISEITQLQEVLDNFANFLRSVGYSIGELENIKGVRYE